MPDRPTSEDFKDAEKLPYPAKQSDMTLQPQSDLREYKAAGKLSGKIALITGADSGIGHEVAAGRPGQPEERSPAYVYLACADSPFVTGSRLRVTGGKLSEGA